MIRKLFAIASVLLTVRIAARGKPGRLGKHLVRRQLHKRLGRILR